MITDAGKAHIKRYLAQFVPSIAQSVAFGIGQRTEAGTDVALQLEATRNNINLISYDFVNNKLVYKASIPEDFVGQIYEIGLFTLDQNPAAGSYASRNLTTFDSGSEQWVDSSDQVTPPTYSSTNTRIGLDSMNHNPAASSSMSDSLLNLSLDLSGNSSADTMVFAFNVGNSNTNSVEFRLLTDSSNYYSYVVGSGTVGSSGYKVVEVSKGSATVTGTPNWSNITEIRVITTSKAGGASNVDFDAIRIEDSDSLNLDYILVARKVLTTPVTSSDGLAQDIEFALDITIT